MINQAHIELFLSEIFTISSYRVKEVKYMGFLKKNYLGKKVNLKHK